MMDSLLVFLAVFLLVLALGLFIAGIFTVYFGSGKSRGIGAGLLVGGIIIGILVFMMFQLDMLFENPGLDGFGALWVTVIHPGMIYIGGAILGALAAIGLFLLTIMKS